MRWDYPPLDINSVFPGLLVWSFLLLLIIIIVIIIIFIIIIIIIIIIVIIIIIIIIIIINTLFVVGSKSSIKANKNKVMKKLFQIPKLNRIDIAYLEGYSEPCEISKELFTLIVNGLKPLTIFVKSSISDIWLGYEYVSYIYWYTVQMQEIFLVSLRFALKSSVELPTLISRGSIFHNVLF